MFSFKKLLMKLPSVVLSWFCPGINELIHECLIDPWSGINNNWLEIRREPEIKNPAIDPGNHVTNNFSLTIQIRWKFHFGVIQFRIIRLQQFLHVRATWLLCHGQNFGAFMWWEYGWEEIEFKMWLKNHWWNGPLIRYWDHSGHGLSHWEMMLQCNIASQWLSPPYPEWFLGYLKAMGMGYRLLNGTNVWNGDHAEIRVTKYQCVLIKASAELPLTHCGLETTHDSINLGHNWQQAITRTNVDCGIILCVRPANER